MIPRCGQGFRHGLGRRSRLQTHCPEFPVVPCENHYTLPASTACQLPGIISLGSRAMAERIDEHH